MNLLSNLFSYFYQFMGGFAFLVLASMGLSIIFGMMGIINLAHGEFIMMGAYMFTLSITNGVPFLISLPIAIVGTAALGYMIDLLVIRRLYNRPLDSVVATWGISLILSQGMRILFGPSIKTSSTPLGSFTIGQNKYSWYYVVLAVIAVVLIALVYFLFMHTKFGIRSRATMQKAAIAEGLGVNTRRIYTMTFMIGSALAGLAGALYAPTMAITPDMGSNFMMESFVTVIVGGSNPLVGTIISGGALGLVNGILSLNFGTFIGRVGLLITAIIFIRVFPQGFSGLVEQRLLKRRMSS